MPLLPAQIPAIPEARSEIVPARLARKVGPLFGVPWEEGPFGHHTWVSDYSRITLSEIARGAPLPTRTQAVRLTGTTQESWHVVDRVGLAGRSTALPNEIANATLNRFGPDTKAAVILCAVNRLLDPVRHAVDDAVRLLVDDRGAVLGPELRLAGWAALVIETFRSQPALVAAGIRARSIQRELAEPWELPSGPRLAGVPLTRCEISAPDKPTAPSQPCDLEVVDATFAALHLDGPSGTALARRLHHDETVDRLLRRLRAAGTLQDSSHLWLSERRPGEVVVEALVPPTRLTHDFVTQVVPADDAGGEQLTLPAVPSRNAFAALPLLSRRAVLIAQLGVLRHLQFSPVRREATRVAAVEALTRLADLAVTGLPADDPVRVVARCRAALMTVQTLRHDHGNDLSAAVGELLSALEACEAAFRAGRLDRGAAAEIIAAANIEINAVRRTNALDPSSGLPVPEDLDAGLRRSWCVHLEALEVTTGELKDPDPERLGLIGYHLQNYSAFLAGHPNSDEDLLAAVRLFRDVVLPARELFLARSGSFAPLRHTLQVASRATCALATSNRYAGDPEARREWAAVGLGWIRRALADPSTRELLADATEVACRFALLAAPALLLAVELSVAGTGAADVESAADLMILAQRWEQRSVGDDRERHTRHAEVAALTRRIDALRSSTASGEVIAVGRSAVTAQIRGATDTIESSARDQLRSSPR